MKRMFLPLLLLGFAVSVMAAPQAAEAQEDLRIGYVDPQEIMMSMPEMAAIERRLNNFVEQKREEFTEKEQNFRRELEEYQERMAVISDQAREREEERLAELNMELQQMQTQFQQEIQERQQELIDPLLDDIHNAIDEVARERGLTYVLNTTTSQGDFIILYASDEAEEQFNITREVKQRLDLI